MRLTQNVVEAPLRLQMDKEDANNIMLPSAMRRKKIALSTPYSSWHMTSMLTSYLYHHYPHKTEASHLRNHLLCVDRSWTKKRGRQGGIVSRRTFNSIVKNICQLCWPDTHFKVYLTFCTADSVFLLTGKTAVLEKFVWSHPLDIWFQNL